MLLPQSSNVRTQQLFTAPKIKKFSQKISLSHVTRTTLATPDQTWLAGDTRHRVAHTHGKSNARLRTDSYRFRVFRRLRMG